MLDQGNEANAEVVAMISFGSLGPKIEMTDSLEVGSARLTKWQNRESHPPMTVVIFENRHLVFWVNENVNTLMMFLFAVSAKILDLAKWQEVLEFALVGQIELLPFKNNDDLNRWTGNRPSPVIEEDALVFYYNNWHTGNVEKLRFKATSGLETQIVGVGLECDLL